MTAAPVASTRHTCRGINGTYEVSTVHCAFRDGGPDAKAPRNGGAALMCPRLRPLALYGLIFMAAVRLGSLPRPRMTVRGLCRLLLRS